MHALSTILAASAIASVAVAKPLPHKTHKQGFSVTGSIPVRRPLPAAQMHNVFLKYGKTPPKGLAAAVESGSVPANPEDLDVSYLCPVTIGGQTLNLDFDTGSSDLWVFSSELKSSQSKGHDIYDPSKSKSAKKVSGATWKISYGDGSSASGDVYHDNVEVGGITVSTQGVELANKLSAQFLQDANNDGLLGLAFSSINTVTPRQEKTWFDNGVDQGLFAEPLFTADLRHGEPGSYDFGFIDKSKYSGDIVYTPIDNSQGFWQFTGTGYGVGSADNFEQSDITAIADTGTTLLMMDDTIVDAYYQQVDGAQLDQQQGGYVFDCSTELPDFILGIGDGQAVIPGSIMNLGDVGGGSGTCFGGLQSNQGLGLSIYGDIFLKAVLAIFDQGNSQFGYAPKADLGSGGNGTGNGTVHANPSLRLKH